MARRLTDYKFEREGGGFYYARVSDNKYKGIASVIGAKKLGNNETANASEFGKGRRSMVILRLNLGGTGNKSTLIYCPVQKVAAALKSLKGKTVNGRKVSSVGIPRSASLA